MGVRFIVDPEADTDAVAMYDSVSGFAFGPVFDSPEEAGAFVEWLDADARTYSDKNLERLYGEWLDSPESEAFR